MMPPLPQGKGALKGSSTATPSMICDTLSEKTVTLIVADSEGNTDSDTCTTTVIALTSALESVNMD